MEDRFYVIIDGKEWGPFTSKELEDMDTPLPVVPADDEAR